jgi:hypothetical protein
VKGTAYVERAALKLSSNTSADQLVNGARCCLDVCKAVNGAHMKLYWFAIIFPYFSMLPFLVSFGHTKNEQYCSGLNHLSNFTSCAIQFSYLHCSLSFVLIRYVTKSRSSWHGFRPMELIGDRLINCGKRMSEMSLHIKCNIVVRVYNICACISPYLYKFSVNLMLIYMYMYCLLISLG